MRVIRSPQSAYRAHHPPSSASLRPCISKCKQRDPPHPCLAASQLQSATAALRSRLSRTHTTSPLAYSCPPGRRSGTAVPGPGTRPLASQRAARTHSSHAPACTLSVHTQHAHTARLAHTQLIAPYHPHSLTYGATASTIAISMAPSQYVSSSFAWWCDHESWGESPVGT